MMSDIIHEEDVESSQQNDSVNMTKERIEQFNYVEENLALKEEIV